MEGKLQLWEGRVEVPGNSMAYEGKTLARSRQEAEENLRFRSRDTFRFLPRKDQCTIAVWVKEKKPALAR